MKILHLIASVNPARGGPVEGVLQVSKIFPRFGHQCDIASLDDPDAPWVKKCSVRVYALGQDRSASNWLRKRIPVLRHGYSRKFVPWLKANSIRYDVIIVNGLWDYVGFATMCALSGSEIPYVVYTHGMLSPWFKKRYPFKHIAKQVVWLFLQRPLLEHARIVLFTTEEERRVAKNAFWPYRFKECVLGYGTLDAPEQTADQVEAFYSAFPQLRGRRFVLFLGRIHPVKGIDLLIRALARFAPAALKFDLVIAGPDPVGWRAGLEKIASAEGVNDRIFWTGPVEGAVKWAMLRAAEALILPSHQENFGMVVAEAMACGRPVLISNKVNICHEVEACGCGVVSSDDLPGTEALLRRFFALSGAEKAEMAAAARRCFLENFDIEFVAKELLDTMEELKNVPDEHATRFRSGMCSCSPIKRPR